MDTLRQDVVYALRRLRQAPGFTLVSVATLALGIGANSAIFSVVNAVLLRPLPYPEPDRLVRVGQVWEGRDTAVYSPQNFLDIEAGARSFERMAAIDRAGITLTGRGAPARLEGAEVGPGFFDVFKVQPLLGRGFTAEESETGHTKVAVLGYGLYTRAFGADPAVVGQSVLLNREPHLVVGVAPPGFSFPANAEIWVPMEYDARFRTNSRGAWYLGVVGRLKPGVAIAHARDEVATVAARLARDYPDANEGVGGTVVSLHEALVGRTRQGLLLLLGAVGLVLLIACVNVANLTLARVAARESELAVRTALGAGRVRLLRQLLTESLVVSLAGGAIGLVAAAFAVDGLTALQPGAVPRMGEVRIDPRVAAFALALSVVTGLLSGVAPALQMLRRAAAHALREGGRGLVGDRGRRLRGGLVVGQIALAMMLLAGAGLLVRSFVRLSHVDPGFRPEGALTFRLSLPESAYPAEAQRTAFFESAMTRLAALPGVRRAGAVTGLPLGGTRFSFTFTIDGRPEPPPAQQPSMEVRVATPGYFETIGIPVLRGRGLEQRDGANAPEVVVLTESAARRFFPGEDPVGQRIRLGMGRGEGKPTSGGEVVGIVADVKDLGLARETPPEIYLPYAQAPQGSLDVLLRTDVSPTSVLPAARAAIASLDGELPLARVRTLDDVVAESIAEPRFYTMLLGAFAAVALLLAALGIFGVMSYAVLQRSREIGIRVALGAAPETVRRMVMGDALVLAAAGVAAGFCGALAFSRTIAGLLFDLSPTDPATLAGMALLLASVALLAGYLPARRATRVDPLIALRSE